MITQSLPEILIDGSGSLPLSAADRGLAYGDGVFETCRVINAAIPLFEGHIQRLLKGLESLCIPLENKEIEAKLKVALSAIGQRSGTLKIVITRGTGGRSYAPPVVPKPSIITLFYPDSAVSFAAAHPPVSLWLCRMPLAINSRLAGIKHLSRLENVMARAEFADDYQEGLLLDTAGKIIECTAHNIFIRMGDELLTPKLDGSGVVGVMRQLIIERLAPAVGLQIRQKDFALEGLKAASEVFICNSNRGIRAVASLFQPDSGETMRWEGRDYCERLQQQLQGYIADQLAEEFVCVLP